MENRFYTIPDAARAADAPEDELRRAIQDGLLLARDFPNTGELRIDAEDLARYVKRSRHTDFSRRERRRKVLLLGEELLFAGTLKLELQRDPRIDARFASWGKDALMMVEHYGAGLFIADLSPSRVAPDEVLSAVSARRREGRGRVLVYSPVPADQLECHPLLLGQVRAVETDAYVSRSDGMRAAVIASYSLLGLDTNTKMLRRQA